MTPESLPEVQGDLIYASKHGFNLETVFTIQIDNNHWLPGSESIGYNLSGSHSPQVIDAHVGMVFSVFFLAVAYQSFQISLSSGIPSRRPLFFSLS